MTEENTTDEVLETAAPDEPPVAETTADEPMTDEPVTDEPVTDEPVMGTEVLIALDGATMRARVFPAAADEDDDLAVDGKYPALVILHDHFGLDEWTLDSARRLSRAGYITLAVNLFARSGEPEAGEPEDTSSDTTLRQFTLNLSDSRLAADAVAAVSWLAQQESIDADRLGVVGWGWGGAYALLTAAHDTRLRAAVDVGGDISYPVFTVEKPGSPLNFLSNIEGALLAAFPGADPLLPADEIRRLIDQMREQEKRGEVQVYDGAGPRFWRDDNAPHTPLLWRRILRFLDTAFTPPEVLEDEDSLQMDVVNESSSLHAAPRETTLTGG